MQIGGPRCTEGERGAHEEEIAPTSQARLAEGERRQVRGHAELGLVGCLAEREGGLGCFGFSFFF
jgi:hypothetical protein